MDGGPVGIPQNVRGAVNGLGVSFFGDLGHDLIVVAGASRRSMSWEWVVLWYFVAVLVDAFVTVADAAMEHAWCLDDGLDTEHISDSAAACLLHDLGYPIDIGLPD